MERTHTAAVERLLQADELAVLAAFGEAKRWPNGRCVFSAGEPGQSMFVVLEGEIKLVFDAGARRKTLGPGTFFGELALLLEGEGRSADAVTSAECRLLELTAEGFAHLADAHPRLAVRLLTLSARALLASERRLVAELQARNRRLERTLDYLRRTREELSSAELKAQTDALTGLYNRRCFDTQLPRLIERATTTGAGLALILIDLDHFKDVNDTYGHGGGDAVLCAVAAALRGAVRWSDLPCRIGGDEFAVALADLAEATAAVARARDIFAALAPLSVEFDGDRVEIGSSHGGAFLRPGESAAELLQRADTSLYTAKTYGRAALVWEGELVLAASPHPPAGPGAPRGA